MLTPERLREIKERCERATPGPWESTEWINGPEIRRVWVLQAGSTFVRGGIADVLSDQRDIDAEFIAHAREDVPALVDEVERLQELKDDYRLRIEHMATALGLIQSEAEALKQAIEAAKSAGGAERLDEIAKHVQAILDVLGRV